jgi:pimeloyl-ACP methyl ester carboxylesterase/1-acyl-sn-glycerol-3-phosphate acyltransferase
VYATETLRFSYVHPPVNGTKAWNTGAFLAPSTAESADAKPLAIYIPGLDGYGISASTHQFDDLAQSFELWRMTMMPKDRSSFAVVVNAIHDFVETQLSPDSHEENIKNKRRVILIGESCGGVFASAAALKLQSKSRPSPLDGLVLVNPATSFDRTAWEVLVPLLASLKNLDPDETGENDVVTPYAVIGSLILSGLLPDEDQTKRIRDNILNLESLRSPGINLATLAQLQEAAASSFRMTADFLPPELLEHRVSRWLTVGNAVIQSRLKDITVPTLVVVGSDDKLMPSASEADRLLKILPNSEKLVVRNRGHLVLDENVNLTEAILFSKIDLLRWNETKKPYDVITDWKLPSLEKIEKAVEETVDPLRRFHSPVYFSTDDKGKRWMGLSKVPKVDGPLLFVGNHQLGAADLRFIFAQLYEERGIVARGLAHPLLFLMNNVTELAGRTPGIIRSVDNRFAFANADFQSFGALPVTPRNYYRLMQTGQSALLFPGGAAEAQSGRRDYPLFWPEKTDFVRTAARFNATIIPFSAIGMVDSVNVLVESEDIFKLPFIGERAKALSRNVTAARYDTKKEDEVLLPPIGVPSLPARNYLLFGRPIQTNDLDYKNKQDCDRVYRETQSAVRIGLDDLIRARKEDPFVDTPKRLAYERVFDKKAPTFPVSELN